MSDENRRLDSISIPDEPAFPEELEEFEKHLSRKAGYKRIIDMSAIARLQEYKRQMKCTLTPRKGKKPCDECSVYNDCKKNKAEREYMRSIYKKRLVEKRKRARVKAQHQKEEYERYVCSPYEDDCPRKNECDGIFCLYECSD